MIYKFKVWAWLPMTTEVHLSAIDDKDALKIFNTIDLTKGFNWKEDGGGTGIERLKDWPDDVPCETNFGYISEAFPSASNITSSGEIKFYYIIQDWMLAEVQISVDKKMPSFFKTTFSFRLD